MFSRVKLTIRPGGTNGAVPMDAKLLKASDKSDALMLNCEMTLMDGPYARRKFWQNFTVAGGKRDEKGESIGWNIAKSSFRAMIDSAVGLDPKDESPAARNKRTASLCVQPPGREPLGTTEVLGSTRDSRISIGFLGFS